MLFYICSFQFQSEEAVRSEFPEAIIFRPADIYGAGDRFLVYYASKRKSLLKTYVAS